MAFFAAQRAGRRSVCSLSASVTRAIRALHQPDGSPSQQLLIRPAEPRPGRQACRCPDHMGRVEVVLTALFLTFVSPATWVDQVSCTPTATYG